MREIKNADPVFETLTEKTFDFIILYGAQHKK